MHIRQKLHLEVDVAFDGEPDSYQTAYAEALEGYAKQLRTHNFAEAGRVVVPHGLAKYRVEDIE